jgi:diguanylate cyclase (GGDEF)-like protein/PAS domain S-box-containing protein
MIRRKIAAHQLVGTLLALFGVLLVVRWVSQSGWLTQMISGSAAVGLVVSMMFVFAGVACALLPRPEEGPLAPDVVLWLCLAMLIAFPSLSLLASALQVPLGIDFVRVPTPPSPTSPYPGRMSPNTCVAILCFGIALTLVRCSSDAVSGRLYRVLTSVVGLIGLVALLGHFLSLEILYRVTAQNRMLAPTAFGVMVMGAALWLLRDHVRSAQRVSFDRHEARIKQRSFIVLALVALGAGTAGFSVMRETFEKSVSDDMLLAAKTNATSMSTALEQNLWLTNLVTTRQTVVIGLARMNAAPTDAVILNATRQATESLLAGAISGIELRGLGGVTVRAGSLLRGQPGVLVLRIAAPGHRPFLLWKDGSYLLSTETEIVQNGRRVGSVVIEQPLRIFDRLLADMRGSSETSDALLCGLDSGTALCAPTRFHEKPLRLPLLPGQNASLPVDRALLGSTGVMTTKDLRDTRVVAAYAHMADFGLGLVVKTDLETLYVPLKERVRTLLLLLAGLVAVGAWALRVQVKPLLEEVVREQQRTKIILDNSNDAFIAVDAEGLVTDWNVQAERIFGHPAAEAIGRPVTALILPPGESNESSDGTGAGAGQAVGFSRFMPAGSGPVTHQRVEVNAVHRSGRLIPIELSIAAFHNGKAIVSTAFASDISERKAAQHKLAASERRLRSITDNLPVLISYVDRERRLTFCNRTFQEWRGADAGKVLNRPIADVIGRDAYDEQRMYMDRALAGEQLRFEMASGLGDTLRHLETTYIPDRQPDGHVAGIYTMSTDVSAFKRVQTQLINMARFDSLTGLPNRAQLSEKLEEAVRRSRRSATPMAVMFLDVDHFKSINDTLGHAAGDAVLVELARRLNAAVRETDTVARLSGDEFVVVLEGLHSAEEPQFVARKIGAAMGQPWEVLGHEMRVSVSIGVAYALDAPAPAELLALADKALYRAKAEGRNTFRVEMYELPG